MYVAIVSEVGVAHMPIVHLEVCKCPKYFVLAGFWQMVRGISTISGDIAQAQIDKLKSEEKNTTYIYAHTDDGHFRVKVNF